MVEVYSEVTAILSSNIISAINGCVEDTLKKYVPMANVVKMMLDNDVQYSLSGTLDGIVAARTALENLLNTLESTDAPSECSIAAEESSAVTEPNDSTTLNESPVLSTTETENDKNGKNCNFSSPVDVPPRIKSSFKKLRFLLRERARAKSKSSPRLYRHYRALLKNMSLSADDGDSDILSKDLEQMKLSTENSSDGDSRIAADDDDDEPMGQVISKHRDGEPSSSFKYLCSICSFKTQRSSHFEKHLAIHNKVSTLFRCNHCTFTSVRLSHLRRHEMTHSSTVHSCTECSYQTDELKFLNRHVRLKHRTTHVEKFSRVLNCPHCSYKTTKQHYFDRHQRMHCSKERRFLHHCDKCSYKTHRKEHYTRHVNNVHNNKRPYLCHLCGKAFKRGDALQQHHQTHDEGKIGAHSNFKCEICSKVFRSQFYLWEHQAVHSEARLFLCEICGASFKTRSVQRKHVATIHRNPRAYSCHSCPKRFNTLFALKRHQKVHIEKLPLQTNVDSSSPEAVLVPESHSVAQGVMTSLPTAAEPINVEMNQTTATITTFDIGPMPQDALNVDLTPLAIQDPQPVCTTTTADIIQQITPAFFQPSENASALLYLTNGLVQF